MTATTSTKAVGPTAESGPRRRPLDGDDAPHSRRLRFGAHGSGIIDVLVVGGTWLIGALVFFSAQWSSNFDRIMGNVGDARLIIYLNEQWYQVLRGSQPWRSPPFFYPVKGLLGYTDTFFLWQVFYAPFRLMGADPFLAFQLTIVVMSLVGFVTFVVLVRLAFRAPTVVAVVGALVFTFAGNLAGHASSPQLFGIYLVPPVALLGFVSWRRRTVRRTSSVVLGCLAGVLVALLLFTTYYVAWFSLLGGLLVAVLALLASPRRAPGEVATAVRTGWRTMAGATIGFAVGCIPFVTTYVPVVRALGTRSYGDALHYAPSWRGVFSVGSGNLVWGHLLSHVAPTHPSPETTFAITPLLWLTVVLGGGALAVTVLTRRVPRTPAVRTTLGLCATLVLVTVLPIDTSAGSAWVLVWHLPGATAIRAIDRIQAMGDLVASAALVGLVTEALRRWRRLRGSLPLGLLGLLLLGLIVVEQAHSTGASTLHRRAEVTALDRVPRPPAGCTSFYVVDTVPNHRPFYAFQTEAMLISQRLDLPTLNGYSGDEPPGWALLFPNTASYPFWVHRWAIDNGLTTGVCRLDLGTYTWEIGPLTG